MNIDAPMTDNIYNEFDEPSLRKVWDILRKTTIPKILGVRYCPVPFLDKPQYYDIFNVYTKTPKKFVDRLKRIIGMPAQFSYVGKLGDILDFPSSKDEDTLAATTNITVDKFELAVPNLNFHTKSRDDKKEITLEIKGAKKYSTNLLFTMSKAYVNFSRINVFRNSIYVITNVCAASSVSLHFRAQFPGSDSTQQWHFAGPVPIAFKLTKFEVGTDGEVKAQEPVPLANIFDLCHWRLKKSRHQQIMDECGSLKLHLNGVKSDATRHSLSLQRLCHDSARRSAVPPPVAPTPAKDVAQHEYRSYAPVKPEKEVPQNEQYYYSTEWEE